MADQTTPTPAARPARGPRDMAISLLMLLVPVLLLFGLFQWLAGGGTPDPVDQEPAVSAARAAGLPGAAPEGLDERWVPVSAVTRPVEDGHTLRLGYLTPSGRSVQVVQSSVPAGTLLPAELGEQARPGDEAALPSGAWRAYTDVRGGPERALVRSDPVRTTIVVGEAPEAELRALAGATP